MVKNRVMNFTKFEVEVLDVLWDIEKGSVREIQERLPEHRRPAYTTVQTIVNRLEDKGAVERVKKIGNAYIFAPTVSRQSVHRKLIDNLLDVFGGSTRPLMAHLIETRRLTLENLRELENTLEEIERDERDEK